MSRIPFAPSMQLRLASARILCWIAVFAAPSAFADELPVTHCADDGNPGSLRSVVATATNLDVVDLRSLSCPEISLLLGEIATPLDNLGFIGAGAAATIIDAGDNSRIFNHGGSGTLALTALTLRHGKTISIGEARGGCVASTGNITLDHAVVAECSAIGGDHASGGGIYSAKTLNLIDSVVSNNTAIKTGSAIVASPSAQGGGAMALDIYVLRSTITGNSAVDELSEASRGGGIDYLRHGYFRRSTIDHNVASYGGGLSGSSSSTDVIFQTTISNNSASVAGGGVYGPNFFNVQQSTVAFNSASAAGAGGIHNSSEHFGLIDLSSTIVANNQPVSSDNADIGSDDPKSFTLSADYSLVMRTEADVLGSVLTADPLLGPLTNNGGPTRTHALMGGSPALQAGWNTTSACDQRLYPRGYYTDADIGSYEDSGDHIFRTDFDSCL